jgi:hypothetical protein
VRIEEKLSRAKKVFESQKEVVQNITLENYFDSIKKIRELELQKEMIIAIPTTKNVSIQ